MMVVKNTGEVVYHQNANELLKVAEDSDVAISSFSLVM